MKRLPFVGLLFLGLGFSSCIKHEVIPAPKPKVELACHFEAKIDGSTVEFTENVNGMACDANKSLQVNPEPDPSTAVYFSGMKSDSQFDAFQIALGKVQYQATVTSAPTLNQFDEFIKGSEMPTFSADAESGIEIKYVDHSGYIWTSDETSAAPQTFQFNILNQESDENGDYMLFTAEYSGTLYNADLGSSIVVTDCVYKGFFKR